MMEPTLAQAVHIAGGPAALARMLEITCEAVVQWKRCPPGRVLDVERITGISRYDLRPDIFGDPRRRS